ncbi:MAG: YchF/TatD family DNA exonuclease [Sphaerochaetaceae bacterium]|nr:YchF/TatD family DNA exonuclease [Sphaerochaetaceae bacterium]
MKNIVDTHFHLMGIKENKINIDELVKKLQTSNFYGGIDICLNLEDIIERKKYLKNIPSVFFATGLGPWNLDNKDFDLPNSLLTLEKTLTENNIQLLGEIGLDYHYLAGTKEKQQELLIKQLELADEINRPVIIHSRESDNDLIDILKTYSPKKRGIIHCFSSDVATAKALLDLGYYISFSGNITYKNSKNIQEAIKIIPSNKLFLETDSPYLSPIPLRGKINTPLNIIYTYEKAAELREENLEELKIQIMKNFATFYKEKLINNL